MVISVTKHPFSISFALISPSSSFLSFSLGWSVLVEGVCLVLLFDSQKILEQRRFYYLRKIPFLRMHRIFYFIVLYNLTCNLVLVLSGVTILCKFLHWDMKLKLEIIGNIPQDLPHFGFFELSWGLSTVFLFFYFFIF
jgi:MFS superfamily sulfate permease-like transporter